MIQVLVGYILFGATLVVYGALVCPFLEDLGYLQTGIITLMPIALVLPIRAIFSRRHARELETTPFGPHTRQYTLPWREFRTDAILWVVMGLGIAGLYYGLYQSPWLTGLKILLGACCFGVFGGMLSFLLMESRIIHLFRQVPPDQISFPPTFFSVSRKILLFMTTVLVFMAMSVLLMVFMNVRYLVEGGVAGGPDIYLAIFWEILFSFGVLLTLSLVMLGLYARNLRAILALQLEVMEDIGRGRYESRVPVVSNDEFGLIAAKTNEMIRGLREREVCEISFGRYVTPEVSERILKGDISLEGELREVTILFCDLRGYTTFVEKQDPKEVVTFLNEYFTVMERCIKGHGGIVLQYIGDEIEAVFGAPRDLPGHPEKALGAALDMRSALQEINMKRQYKGREPVAHGIGIHTGTVLAGSVGSTDRLVYALVGDTVNSASRIQTVNKEFGTDILISEQTRQRISSSSLAFEGLGRIALKGKKQQMEIFKVL